MAKYSAHCIDAEYLIYADSDTVFSGRIEPLLNVSSGKVGFVSEKYLGYTIRDQFNSEDIDDSMFISFGIDPKAPSVNSGVFCGRKKDICSLHQQIEHSLSECELSLRSRTDQGLLAIALASGNLHHVLPNQCNMIDEYWDGHSACVLHFAGWPRPWITGSARPDNSYAAFKTWRDFSHISDFSPYQKALLELYWRLIDPLRLLLRKFRAADRKSLSTL
jgi:lipopolysaccharide biosynthesis glycosyltransferase